MSDQRLGYKKWEVTWHLTWREVLCLLFRRIIPGYHKVVRIKTSWGDEIVLT